MSQTDFPFSRSTIRYVAILLLTAFMGIASFIGVFELQNEREAGGRLFYAEQTQEMHRRFELLVESELQSYSLFASSLAIHPDLIQSLETQNPALAERFVYQTLEESKLHRPVENLWIHLIDSSLHSFYRSWSFKRGDDLSIVRPELSLLLENPTPLAQMSLGIFTLSLKHTHPIQKEGKLLGFLEVIAPLQETMLRFSQKHSIQSALLVNASLAAKVTQQPYSLISDQYALLYATDSRNLTLLEGLPLSLACQKNLSWEKEGVVFGASCLRDSFGAPLGYLVFFLDEKELGAKLEQNLAPLSRLIFVLTLASALLFLLFWGYARSARLEFRSIQNLYERLVEESRTDSLTRLPNRHAIRLEMQNQSYAHLLLLNIDSFRTLNDFYGSDVGDDLLIEFAKRLKMLEQKHTGLKAYRLHADEFALLSSESMEIKKLLTLTHRFMTQGPYRENRHRIEIMLSLSIGAAKASPQALEQADIALNLAKSSNDSYKLYAPELENHHKLRQHITLTKRLKEALREDRLIPYFQPIVNSKGHIQKYECLARIIESNGEVLSPYLFLQIAKKSKLYPKITQKMVQKSFKAFEKSDHDFSINLSFEDIAHTKTRDFILKSLQDYPKAKQVIFEIVETENIHNYKLLEDFIKEIKRFGARVAIDDFGSGYSNFLHLAKLRVDFIKIDGSLIQGLGQDSEVEIIVHSIVEICQRLGIQTIAEFIDNEPLSHKASEMGIDFQQGFYFYEPSHEIRH